METRHSTFDSSSDQVQVYSISELTNEIKALLQTNFSSIWVEGEISNFKKHFSSGHMYFTLKDPMAELPSVMFKGYNQHIKFPIQDGMKVLAQGDISVYLARGQYQLLVKRIEPAGLGTLYLAFEAMKKKLEAEGLFDESLKRTIPPYPFKIGIVTSATGAAVDDIRQVLARRAPHAMAILRPTLVQGEGAQNDIVSAIMELENQSDIDLIILGRGGGSLEDLWAFNEEKVIRSIVNCNIPIISAVGHETDFTLADFAADLRAPTPSAAAELASPSADEILSNLKDIDRWLVKGIRNRVQMAWQSFDKASSRYGLQHPRILFEQQSGYLRDKSEKLAKVIHMILSMKTAHFKSLQAQLLALNPIAILDRGYSIALRISDRKILKSSKDIIPEDGFYLQLAKGEIEAKAIKRRK